MRLQCGASFTRTVATPDTPPLGFIPQICRSTSRKNQGVAPWPPAGDKDLRIQGVTVRGTRNAIPRSPNSHEPVRGGGPAAVRGAQEPGEIAPGAAAQNAPGTFPALPRRAVCRRSLVILVPTILHPLIHVPVHVVQAPAVGTERSHRRRLCLVPLTPAANTVGPVATDPVPPTVDRLRPRPRRTPSGSSPRGSPPSPAESGPPGCSRKCCCGHR